MKRLGILLLLLGLVCCLHAQKRGMASFYARKLNNKRTSSGALYKRDSMTCAYRTHPFGTKLLVRDLDNGKTVIVKIIDRGPFTKGRIIDLSYAAAKKLGMIRKGVAMVTVRVYVPHHAKYKKPKKKESTSSSTKLSPKEN